MRAPKITSSEIALGAMIPRPTVLATCNPKTRKAMKLKNAAHATAERGARTRVDTIVAMELGASLRPFRKSTTSAMAIRATRIASTPSDLFDHDAADAVRYVLKPVHDLLEMVVDLDADDVAHGIAVAVLLEQRLDAVVIQRVGIVFEADDLFGDRVQPPGILAQRSEKADCFHGKLRCLENMIAHLRHLGLKR